MPARRMGTTAKVSSLSCTPSVSQMGGFHLHLYRGQIARRLIGLERRELVDKLAEVRGGGAFVAQNRHLMADQRVVEHGKAILVVRNVGHGLILSE